MKALGKKIAVISNGSLIDNPNVQTDLMKADLVSLKIDAIQEAIWMQINRPHEHLKFHRMLDGIQNFSDTYHEKLITETMRVGRINDQPAHLEKLAAFLDTVCASKVNSLVKHKKLLRIQYRGNTFYIQNFGEPL